MLHFHEAFTAAANPQGFLRMLEQEQRERERHFQPVEMRACEYPQPARPQVSGKPNLLARLRQRWQQRRAPLPNQGCTA